ncbi:selenide,water dikinase, putative [Roseobacter sp. SK209-2-6]|uniref:selenide, water dikinase SelD n=1 Tax=Roseobacter sp. SK209-2-6 TaxID=388739 RepID=UPI0000F3F270|nr:selenide, water dikinase SelD [Roseobacter sp. SK209-2-6]EBA14352.1 selenide,water dikinase, putative [Roseobacter sp. SK209-2-6]
MHSPPLPATQDVVLIGGGHTHALFLLKWGMKPLPGARLTVINPGPTAPYSGMLPGFVAGHYTREELDIDLVRLARFAGARVILGAAEHLDPEAREVHVTGRPPIVFDLASVDVGITSQMPGMPGFAEHGIPAKPLGPFAQSWQEFREGTGPVNIAVIGGGVAGAELVLAMAYALKLRGRLGIATLIDSGPVLGQATPRLRKQMLRAFSEHRVSLVENAEIARVEADRILLTDGRSVLADFTTGAAGARPHDWLSQSGLALQDGFIQVGETLQSSDPAIFATGDCAHLSHAPRPKAGVYAVRQAPVLFHNMRALLTGDPLRRYQPQQDYLKLISLGSQEALGDRFGQQFAGPLVWRWKDRIDRNFMEKFRELPKMEPAELPPEHTDDLPDALGEKPMCGGCGAKAGRLALRAALADLPPSQRADIESLPGDDAAVLRIGEARQVISTDHLRAFTQDPYLMARIAAVHALGDIWAMGATPQAATANLILPRLSPKVQERTLREIMQGASQVFQEAGAEIVGGHTSLGDELSIGFTVTGLCSDRPITLAGAQAGDHLILTKPIGSGVLMAAEMAGEAQGADVAAALTLMCQAQGKAATILRGANAMTDVTGFGLTGHLLGICEASDLGAQLDMSAIPQMPGAAALSDAGTRSSLFKDNLALAPELAGMPAVSLLFDPQTAGGLLAAVSPDQVELLIQELRDNGYQAACIGQLASGPPSISLL